VSFTQRWAKEIALGETCSDIYSLPENNEIGRHMNTVPVARDMLAIVEKHDELVSREKTRLTLWQRTDRSSSGRARLQYWGFSYGTVLGMTFAALYPDRVKKMVLDGVVDLQDYHRGYWHKAVTDADGIPTRFAKYCASAGSTACAFHPDSLQKSSPRIIEQYRERYYSSNLPQNSRQSVEAEILQNFKSLIWTLYKTPLLVRSSHNVDPDIITGSDLLSYLRDWTYQFYNLSPQAAEFLAALYSGNGTSFAAYKQASLQTLTAESNFYESKMAIECSDMDPLLVDEDTYRREFWDVYRRQSWLLGNRVALVRMMCAAWSIRPQWGFDGLFL
jgi:hypothetical protein